MNKKEEGVSRRGFLAGATALAVSGLLSGTGRAQVRSEASPKKTGTRLILLGTAGGPRVTKGRSQPSLAIMADNSLYIVDCGEGLSKQAILADLPLRSLRYIFITHHHSDHNLDYGNLIYDAWASGFKGRIDSYGPPPLEKVTKLYLEMNSYDINIRIPDEGRPPLAPMIHVHEAAKAGLVMDNGVVKVTSALVNHPPVEPAFAYRFDTPDRSIVFSGDTTPSESLIALARGADVLIHEVIHKPSLARLMARIPNADRLVEHIVASHTTHIDVGKVAKAAGVKTLVLTHFVPSDDPTHTDEMWLEGARTHFDGKIIVGKDLMEI